MQDNGQAEFLGDIQLPGKKIGLPFGIVVWHKKIQSDFPDGPCRAITLRFCTQPVAQRR